MVRLLCVIRVENNINNNNKNNSSLWSKEERRRKVFERTSKRRWSGLCFYCLHAKVVSHPARVVLALGVSRVVRVSSWGCRTVFSRTGSQTPQPTSTWYRLELKPLTDLSSCACANHLHGEDYTQRLWFDWLKRTNLSRQANWFVTVLMLGLAKTVLEAVNEG